ncbi:hypothetical protein PEC302107_30580 [Pectobacterium araliae]|uniref:Tryptophan synthase beta chain-like PALP domain-containing protein n=1 Tax=Pectobacterium araliae TaxID=3073862 RepID=A0AAN0KJW8_9GAMM|nr:hypothetical protein PEC302110_34600 [Pectobacterium sp. MAFF 302110]GKW21329.1 hypothetical protein PEC302107_30580 [Pectobacterium carotovorum subsp. carotovorum]
MSRVLTIITDDAPGLHGIADPVIDFDPELRRIIGDLQATLADFRLRAGFGWAMAAPQVDIPELIQHEIDHLDGILMTDRAMSAGAIRPIAERSALINGQRPAHRLSLDHIRQAPDAIDPVFLNTPQYECPQLSAQLGRGAGLVIAGALARSESRPLVCASAGNWGLVLAFYCHKASLPVTVFAAKNANPLKIEAIAAYSAGRYQAGRRRF